MYCIQTKELTHHFSGKEIALNTISIQVPEGSIYGFL
jgi:ABC-type multidrug transport system ATPase subunit